MCFKVCMTMALYRICSAISPAGSVCPFSRTTSLLLLLCCPVIVFTVGSWQCASSWGKDQSVLMDFVCTWHVLVQKWACLFQNWKRRCSCGDCSSVPALVLCHGLGFLIAVLLVTVAMWGWSPLSIVTHLVLFR